MAQLLHGKYGSIAVGAVSVKLSDWSLDDDGDEIDGDHFGQTTGNDGIFRHYKEIGFVNTTATIKGKIFKDQLWLVSVLRAGAEFVNIQLLIRSASGNNVAIGFSIDGVVKKDGDVHVVKDAFTFDVTLHVNNLSLVGFTIDPAIGGIKVIEPTIASGTTLSSPSTVNANEFPQS